MEDNSKNNLKNTSNINLPKLDQILNSIRGINQIIIKEKSSSPLIQNICDLLVKERGYLCALIVLLDDKGMHNKSAQSGWKKEFSSYVKRVKKNKVFGCGDKALKKEGVHIITKPYKECADCPHAQTYKDYGALTTKLAHNNKTYGFFTVTVPNAYLNNDEEHTFFEEISGDISFALYNIEAEKRRREMEKTLRESEEKFRTIAENSIDIIWKLNKKLRFSYISPSSYKIMGYHPDEIIGKPLSKFSTKIDFATMSYYALRTIANPKKHPYTIFESKLVHKDGYLIDVEISGGPLYNSKGKIIELQGNTRDISERNKAKETLQNSEKKYRTIFDTAANLIFSLDKKGNIIECNDQIKAFLGYPKKEIINRSMFDIVHPAYKEVTKDLIKRTLRTGVTYNREFKMLRKNGGIIDVSINSSGIDRTKDSYQNIICIINNITERKRTEDALIRAKLKAEESDRLKSAFLANMSHEIRTPMNGILGFTDLLKNPNVTPEEQQRYVEIINKSGTRLLNTVNDIIEVSKIETGQSQTSYSVTNINNVMKELLVFFKPEVERKGMTLSLKNGLETLESCINIDKSKFHSIITNLIKNAIKYSDEGSIEFGYKLKKETDQEVLEFYVSDTGIGIAEDRQKAIFDRFIQADIDDVRAFQGSGLGLSIAKSYVEMLGGKIRLNSIEGVGSHFFFTIPYNKPVKLHRSKNKDQNSGSDFKIKDLKVLIAEDDKYADMQLSIVINEMAKEIIHVKSGIEAVEQCSKNPDFDLVLMDVKMPEMNGLEATKKIRILNKNLVIIAQTAYALPGDKEKALEAGCNDYITKPINKEELLSIINKNLLKK